MPKVKWGLSEADLDEAERSEDEYTPYDGPMPPRGVYGLRIRRIKLTESSNGNDQMRVSLVLDPRGRKDHKRYNGFTMLDFVPVMASTNWRVRRLLAALGVSNRDFVNKTTVDEDGNILKIGSVRIEGGNLLVVAQIKQDGEYMNVERYLPKRDEEEQPSDEEADEYEGDDEEGDDTDSDDADEDADDTPEEPEPPRKPAAAGKKAAGKKGKAPF